MAPSSGPDSLFNASSHRLVMFEKLAKKTPPIIASQPMNQLTHFLVLGLEQATAVLSIWGCTATHAGVSLCGGLSGSYDWVEANI